MATFLAYTSPAAGHLFPIVPDRRDRRRRRAVAGRRARLRPRDVPRLYAMRADAAEELPANDRELTASAR
jgi:hypothetical protein